MGTRAPVRGYGLLIVPLWPESERPRPGARSHERTNEPGVAAGADLQLGVYNERGFVTRGYAEGGQQERTLANKYRSWASGLAARWPLTAETLREIADGYELDARRADDESAARLDH